MLRRVARSLLARVYVASVLLVLGSGVVVVAVALALDARSPTFELTRVAAFVADDVATADDVAGRARRAHDALGASIALFDAEGRTILAEGAPLEPPAQRPREAEARTPLLFDVPLADGRLAVVALPPAGPPPTALGAGLLAMLVLVGISSFLAARYVSRPLSRLTRAAHAIASGDLGARTGVRGDDEIGETARVFDTMADRVESLMRSHRELLASVSHELRTPLARLRAALEIAGEARELDAVHAELRAVEDDVQEIESLIATILATARIQEGVRALPLRTSAVSVGTVAQHAVARFRARHPTRALEVRIDEAGPERELDPDLVRRAIENVLENAHKYSLPERSIRLAVSWSSDRCVVEIEDEGVGIAPGDLEHVFTPFFRGSAPEVRAQDGLGLGLVLTRRILEAHGGTVAIESELGRGTRVRLSL